MIRDWDQRFTESFDRLFQNGGIQIVRTPFRAPPSFSPGGRVAA
jgi:hypothetical protein